MMNNNQHIDNINKLLINALKFYAEPENYKNKNIELDGGVQAISALKTVDMINKEYENAEDKYLDYVDKIKEDETLKKEFLDALNNIKNFKGY
jgi:hypothetical protein